MIQVDLPAAFTVGQVAGLLSRNYLKKEPDKFTNKLLGPLNFYLCCCFIPGGLFLLLGWPSWESMYTTSWVEAPFNRPLVAGFYVLFVILLMVLGNVGFISAHHWLRSDKDKYVVWGAIIGFILTVLPFFLRWGIWMKIGTYADIEAGLGYSFWEPPFFYGWLFIMSYISIAMILFGWWLWKRDTRFLSSQSN